MIEVNCKFCLKNRGVFQKFKNPESTDVSAPAMEKGPRSNSTPGRQAMSNQTV